MPPKANADADNKKADGPPSQDVRFIFECLRNMEDNKVNLAGVMEAVSYTNIVSVRNRLNAMREKYQFSGLEYTFGNGASPSKRKATPAEADDGASAPAKRGPGRPPKKAKGARAKGAAATAEATSAAKETEGENGIAGDENEDTSMVEVGNSNDA